MWIDGELTMDSGQKIDSKSFIEEIKRIKSAEEKSKNDLEDAEKKKDETLRNAKAEANRILQKASERIVMEKNKITAYGKERIAQDTQRIVDEAKKAAEKIRATPLSASASKDISKGIID